MLRSTEGVRVRGASHVGTGSAGFQEHGRPRVWRHDDARRVVQFGRAVGRSGGRTRLAVAATLITSGLAATAWGDPAYRYVVFLPTPPTFAPEWEFWPLAEQFAPFSSHTMATGLSDNGIVVGVTLEWVDPDDDDPPAQFVHRAFVWQAGDALDPSILQPQTVMPLPINGDFVGDDPNTRQLQWNAAFDVNSSGDIVGDTNVSPGNEPTQQLAFMQPLRAGLQGVQAGVMNKLETGSENTSIRLNALSITDRNAGSQVTVVGSSSEFASVSPPFVPEFNRYGEFPCHDSLTYSATRWVIAGDEVELSLLSGTASGGCSPTPHAFGINRRAGQEITTSDVGTLEIPTWIVGVTQQNIF